MRTVLCNAFERIKALTVAEVLEPQPRADEVTRASGRQPIDTRPRYRGYAASGLLLARA
jgi:hypothetical protein